MDRQTDRQTDGRTDRIAISISRISVLTHDKNDDKLDIICNINIVLHTCERISTEFGFVFNSLDGLCRLLGLQHIKLHIEVRLK